MGKYALIAVIIIAAFYFLYYADPYPGEVNVQGITLGVKQDLNNTLDKEFDIFSYRDSSNHHVLIFGIRNDSVRTLEDFTRLYLSNFKRQGFAFSSDGSRHLGVKKDEVIYMTRSDAIQGAVIYIEKSDKPVPASLRDGTAVFAALESISFK